MAKFPLLLVYPRLEDAFEFEDERCIALYDLDAYYKVGNFDDQDSGSWHDASASHTILLSIRYKDIGTDAIQVGYSHDGSTETTETVVTKTNSGEWKWKHYTIATTVKFAHAVYENFENADIKLTCASELFLTNVTLKRNSTKARAVWRIDLSEEITDNDSISDVSGGAPPSTASYVTISNESALSAERALAVGAGLSKADGGAGSSVTLDLADAVAGAGLVISSKILAVGAGNGITVNANDVALASSAAGAGLTYSSGVLAVGAGNGITVNADDVALTTPGTLAVGSSNSASGNHTHAITSSSNPGAAAALLATNSSGVLTLVQLDTDTISDKSGGNLTIAPTGDIVLDPAGNDILPNSNYDLNLGALSKKFLTLHAAELWVETLVAQNTLATIGGRILILPTNILIADAGTGATTLDVKYNNLASGDRIYLEANGSVEFMAVTSGASVITGGYRYSVTRNLDGSGANQWYAGDALANTGTTGNGFIDLYSVRGVKASSEEGPTIAGNVRNSSTYNDWSTVWAIGNLNGLYGYGATTPGAAFGKYVSGQPNLTIDTTNGIRIRNFTTTVGQWDTSGNITVGEVGASKSNVYLTSNKVQLRTNTTVHVELDTAGKIIVGEVANSKARTEISAGVLDIIDRNSGGTDKTKFRVKTDGTILVGTDITAAATTNLVIFTGNQTYNSESVEDGDLLIGDNSSSKANILWDKSAGQLKFRGGTTTQAYIGTDGKIYAGGANVWLDVNGLGLAQGTGTGNSVSWYSGATLVTSISNEVNGSYNSSVWTIDSVGGTVNSTWEVYAEGTDSTSANVILVGAGVAGFSRFEVGNASLVSAGDLHLQADAYAPSGGTKNNVSTFRTSHLEADPSGNITITGFADGYNGKVLFFINKSSNNVTFNHLDTGSNLTNRIRTSNAAAQTITGIGFALFLYSGSRWNLVAIAT
jgi:hypothetical protein